MHMKASSKWDMAADVVILGAGAAGVSAAIEAAGSGAEVLVIEKERNPFQSATVISEGAISFAGTDLQAKRGIEDSNELYYTDLVKVGRAKNDVALVRAFIERQLDTYYWLKGKAVEFRRVEAAAGMSVSRAHITRMGKLMTLLTADAEGLGARFLFYTRAERLATDETGRVEGARVAGRDGGMLVGARKGVIVATGGFGRSDELSSLMPIDLTKIKNLAAKGSTGDGLKMALELGAGFRDLAYIRPTFGAYVDARKYADILFANYSGAIIVNRMGRRFVDESVPYKEIGSLALSQPQGLGIMVFDAKIKARVEKHWKGSNSHLQRMCKEAPTLGELAQMVDVPAEALLDTIERYNGYVDRNDDLEFGRKGCAGSVGRLQKVDTPPFYAFEALGALIGTYAGVTIDPLARVRNVFGEVIPGLYAAGEVMAGFHGAGYMTGTALAKAFVFGRIAGRQATA